MAQAEIKLPDIGEGVNEGELVRWLVKEGDSVAHDQPLVEIMTDKATVEIPCSSAGKVVKLVAKEGDVVKVGGVLLVMDENSATQASAPTQKSQTPAATQKPSDASRASGSTTSVSAAPRAAQPAASSSGSLETASAYAINPPPVGENILASPATRRYARESGVDLNIIRGSGPAGRVTREDVINAKASSSGGTSTIMRHTVGAGATVAGQPAYKPEILKAPAFAPPLPGQLEERKPLRGIRKKIAENLQRSKQIIPHFTHADECDVTELVAWRSKLKEVAAAQGVKLTYLPIIMKAIAITCREFPQFNASIDDAAGEIVYKHYFNVGFAADTPEGLLVPNVKNVESKTILELARDIEVLAEKARTGKLAPDDMKHGTVTITNIGSIGGTYATPIINHPEVAIFGIYKIQKKPVVVNNEIVIREMMNITATCDHRLVDGAAAGRFLNKLISRLQNPQSLLLEMV